MTRPKKLPETRVPPAIVADLATRLKKSRKSFESQEELAEWVGVKQASISRFLASVHDEEEKRQPYFPGPDIVATVAKRYGLRFDELMAGMVRDGKWETNDMIARRGRALDLLSDDYSDELLAALKAYNPPPSDPGWTVSKWLDHLVKVKSAWEAGVLELPGMKRG